MENELSLNVQFGELIVGHKYKEGCLPPLEVVVNNLFIRMVTVLNQPAVSTGRYDYADEIKNCLMSVKSSHPEELERLRNSALRHLSDAVSDSNIESAEISSMYASRALKISFSAGSLSADA